MAQIEILEDGQLVNTVEATPAFMQTQPVEWRLSAEQAPPVVPMMVVKLSKWGFRSRFTSAERAAIEWAAVDRADLSLEQRMVAAGLRADLEDQKQAGFIDLSDAATIAGVNKLEALGIIGVGRAEAILTAPITESERP